MVEEDKETERFCILTTFCPQMFPSSLCSPTMNLEQQKK